MKLADPRMFIGAVVALLMLFGCATPKEYTPPPKANLQDPLPEMGLVYLMRAPSDGSRLTISLDGIRATDLPPTTYTVLSIKPGSYVLTTAHAGGTNLEAGGIPPFTFELKREQRLLLFLPAPERAYVPGFSFVPIGKGAVVPIQRAQPIASPSQRSWTVGTEHDANWFTYYSKLYVE